MTDTEGLVDVVVLDTETGQTAVCNTESLFEWTDNNFTCDCNRRLLFDDLPEIDIDGCEGCKRFVVVRTSVGSIDKMNKGYPIELREVARHWKR